MHLRRFRENGRRRRRLDHFTVWRGRLVAWRCRSPFSASAWRFRDSGTWSFTSSTFFSSTFFSSTFTFFSTGVHGFSIFTMRNANDTKADGKKNSDDTDSHYRFGNRVRVWCGIRHVECPDTSDRRGVRTNLYKYLPQSHPAKNFDVSFLNLKSRYNWVSVTRWLCSYWCVVKIEWFRNKTSQYNCWFDNLQSEILCWNLWLTKIDNLIKRSKSTTYSF